MEGIPEEVAFKLRFTVVRRLCGSFISWPRFLDIFMDLCSHVPFLPTPSSPSSLLRYSHDCFPPQNTLPTEHVCK